MIIAKTVIRDVLFCIFAITFGIFQIENIKKNKHQYTILKWYQATKQKNVIHNLRSSDDDLDRTNLCRSLLRHH